MIQLMVQISATPTVPKSIWDHLLSFLYTIAHAIGMWGAKTIAFMFNLDKVPLSIVDPLGFLVVLTLFFILLSMARKVAWILLLVGWILLLVRIVMVVFRIH